MACTTPVGSPRLILVPQLTLVDVRTVVDVPHCHKRPWQERRQLLDHTHRARARPAAAVRRAEGLVQVEVHDVEAQLGRLGDPDDRVQVGAVAVDQPAGLVHQPGDLQHVLLEEAQRVGIGQHEAHHRVVQVGLESLQIDVAAAIRGQFDHLQAGHARRRRVSAVRRVGHQDLGALGLTPVDLVLAHDQHAGQLAVRAGCGLQRHCVKACHLGQVDLQLQQELHGALHHVLVLQRVDVGEAGQGSRLLVHLGVVLHGARTQGIEGRVDTHIALAQSHEVAYHIQLAQLR